MSVCLFVCSFCFVLFCFCFGFCVCLFVCLFVCLLVLLCLSDTVRSIALLQLFYPHEKGFLALVQQHLSTKEILEGFPSSLPSEGENRDVDSSLMYTR